MTQTAEKQFDRRINHAPAGFNPETDLPKGFYEFLLPLHREFTPRQQELAKQRAEVLQNSHKWNLPNYLQKSEATESDWKIELPAFANDQRNQMTGPADDAELSVKMLNSGAPGVMLDLEDSMANSWTNLERGINNVIKALHGELTYYDFKRERHIPINSSNTVTFTRARGLHINQAGVIGGELLSASLYDVARIAFGVEKEKLSHPLCFYIPKSESAEEALWWRDVFQAIEQKLGFKKGTIKCMALVESHPLAYQMEEFIYNLREHIIGLNLGRWDYMASLIHFNLHDENWVLPDRNTIPHDVSFFQNLRELLVEICHKRGILAIGGMTALFPSRLDSQLNERALKVLEVDKNNESSVGMDGAWTGHPDQNAIAVAQFPKPNQNFKRAENAGRYPNLRPSIVGVGKRTLDGTRAAIRTVIRYRNGVLCGKGASLLDGYMEDLATDRIYRLMIAQRMQHSKKVEILDETGKKIVHTAKLISQLFDEELEKIKAELPKPLPKEFCNRFTEARRISEEMIINGQHDPI
jgi:malate synthase